MKAKNVALAIGFVAMTLGVTTAQSNKMPDPPVTPTGDGVTGNYSTQEYSIPGKGNVMVQYWEHKYDGPTYTWVVKQAHVVIDPPPGSDIEDFDFQLEKPCPDCKLSEWMPKLNSPGFPLSASVSLSKNPELSIGSEVVVGSDDVQIEKAPGSGHDVNDAWWTVDWDDLSTAAESKASLNFYALWRCPKGKFKKAYMGLQTAKTTFMAIEFDDLGPDSIYYLREGKISRPGDLEKELQKEKEAKKEKAKKTASVWTPPNGTTRIAAVGTVRDEKVKMTSRGSIGGTVVIENEDGEELAEVTPDENGNFSIDFGQIAMGAVATALVLTALDKDGNPTTSTEIDYIPGDPGPITEKPFIEEPEIPFMENQQIGQLEGANFGEDAEVLVTNEDGEQIPLETVSASNGLLQLFVDVPVGPVEVSVSNELGESEPIELRIYDLDVRAGKMNLVRGEQTRITANFDGLPIGTKIIFTNQSQSVSVKPKGRAKTSGNEVTFTLKEMTGEVLLDLKAKRGGGWSVDYRLEFPE